jgi:hypothetical protein
MGAMFSLFFFHFLGIKILAKFDLKIAKLVDLQLNVFSQFLCQKWRNFARKKKDTGWMGASRTRQVQVKHKGER